MKREFTTSLLFNTGLFILVVILGYGSYGAVKQAIDLKKENTETNKKIQVLMEQKRNLENRIAELQTSEAVERAAKENLNLKKAGEHVVIVIPEENKNVQNAQPQTLWRKIKSFFRKLLPW